MKQKIIEIIKEEKDASIRFEVLEKFYHKVDCESDVQLLIDILKDDYDPCVRHEAAAQLFRVAERKPLLLQNLKSKAIETLLDKACNDVSTVVRHESIEALGYIADLNALKDLEHFSKSDNLDIHSTAHIALKTAKRRLEMNLTADEVTNNIIATWTK